MSGEQIAEVPIWEAVEPYIKVKAPKGRRGWNDGEDDEAAENSVARRKKRGRKGRAKSAGAGQKEGSVEGTPTAEDGPGEANAGQGDGDAETTPGPAEGPAQPEVGTQEPDKTVLVIHKISSFDLGEHGRFLVFSAVG